MFEELSTILPNDSESIPLAAILRFHLLDIIFFHSNSKIGSHPIFTFNWNVN